MGEAFSVGFGNWWRRWRRDLVEGFGGGVGGGIWWRDLVEGNDGGVGGGIW